MSLTSPTLAVVAAFRARPGQEDALGQQQLDLVAPTRQEPGSRLYHICRSETEPALWTVMEIWQDRAAFDFHMNTPYVSAFMARVPQLCEGEPSIGFHAVASPDYAAPLSNAHGKEQP